MDWNKFSKKVPWDQSSLDPEFHLYAHAMIIHLFPYSSLVSIIDGFQQNKPDNSIKFNESLKGPFTSHGAARQKMYPACCFKLRTHGQCFLDFFSAPFPWSVCIHCSSVRADNFCSSLVVLVCAVIYCAGHWQLFLWRRLYRRAIFHWWPYAQYFTAQIIRNFSLPACMGGAIFHFAPRTDGWFFLVISSFKI